MNKPPFLSYLTEGRTRFEGIETKDGFLPNCHPLLTEGRTRFEGIETLIDSCFPLPILSTEGRTRFEGIETVPLQLDVG